MVTWNEIGFWGLHTLLPKSVWNITEMETHLQIAKAALPADQIGYKLQGCDTVGQH